MTTEQLLLMHQRLASWHANGETGASSEFMAARAAGFMPDRIHWPIDASDLLRCYRLVIWVPEVREFFPQVAASHPKWAVVMAHWDELTAQLPAAMVNGDAAITLTRRMRELGL
ncbi:MAG: hypothetical protein RJA36_3840 [Pseudomonadota bacterium]|jgi:hypothetical protein